MAKITIKSFSILYFRQHWETLLKEIKKAKENKYYNESQMLQVT